MARTVEECTALLEALAPEFRRAAHESTEELEVGVAWLEAADPLVAARVGEAAARFPRRRALDWPLPEIDALFMREVADVHRDLYAENAELYGESVAVKIERCLAVSDREAAQAERARAEYRERCDELLEGLDLLLTPTLVCVAPPTGVGDHALRGKLIRNTLPFNTLVRVTNKTNGREVDVRINDRGPFIDGRVIDLSLRAAREIDMARAGVAPVKLKVLKEGQAARTVYCVQVGAFENLRAADVLKQQLEKKYPAVTVQSFAGETTIYRVRIGREPDIQAAQKLAGQLRKDDLKPFVVRVN